MVDYGLEIFSERIDGRIQIRESRRSSCRKLQANDSVVTEMSAVLLFHATGNVTCTVTGEWYASLLEQSVILVLQARRCDATTMFLQDGAPLCIARGVNQLLHCHFFDDRIISLQLLTAWPPRSLDSNPCDIWLRGYLKAMVYRDPITFLSKQKKHKTPCT